MAKMQRNRSRFGSRRPAEVAEAPQPQMPAWQVDNRWGPLLAVMLFALFFYMSVSQDALQPHALRVDQIAEPNPLFRAIKFFLLSVGTLFVLSRFSLVRQEWPGLNKFYPLFVLLVAASIEWSIDPPTTLTRFGAIVTITVVCLAFTLVNWHPRRFQTVLRPIFTLLLGGALVFGLLFPDLAKEVGTDLSLNDAWRGYFYQKNTFGEAASIGVLLWTHAWLAREVKFLHFAAGFGISIACVLLSRSSTSLFVIMLVVPFLLLTLRGPRRPRVMAVVVTLFVVVMLLYSLAVLNIFPALQFLLEPVTAFTGKDLTFTGRTDIWAIIRDHISERPWLGSGYGAYWVGPVRTSPSYIFLKKLYFYPTESHNGYLDVMNDLGYVGLACLLGYLYVLLRQCLQLRRIDFTQATLYLALMFEQMVNNLTESNWFSSQSFVFAIMTLVTFALARASAEQRMLAAAGVPDLRTLAASMAAPAAPAYAAQAHAEQTAPAAAPPQPVQHRDRASKLRTLRNLR